MAKQKNSVEPVTEYAVGEKIIPLLHWPDRSSIHLMGHKIEGGQDPVAQLKSWLDAWIKTQEEMVAFGWQCYQDRCENAYVEQSVLKRLDQEHRAIIEIGRRLLEWARMTGGWEAPCWLDLEAFIGKADHMGDANP